MEDAIFGLGLENSWLQLRQVNVDDIGDVEGLRLFSPFKCCWFPKISSIWKGSFVFFSLTSYIEISSHLLMGDGGVLGSSFQLEVGIMTEKIKKLEQLVPTGVSGLPCADR